MQTIKVKKKDFLKSRFSTVLNTVLYKKSIEHLNKGYHNLVVLAFDHIGHDISIEGIYEKEELVIIEKWLKTNNLIRGAALDIGANIGNHSLFFSKLYKWVYAFEPHPLTIKLLELNTNLYAENVTTFQLGLSDKEDLLPFFLAKNANLMGAKLVYSGPDNFKKDEIVNVKVLALDGIAILKDIEIGLIKIDVEGAELNVLKGGKQLILSKRPVILFEQHLENFKDGRSEVIDFLEQIGYKFYIIKSSPVRSGNNKLAKRISNMFIELLIGRKSEIISCEYFTPGFYNMIIAVHD